MKKLKSTEMAALWGTVAGITAGGGFAWFLPGAVWWVPVVFGLAVAGGVYQQTIKDIAVERVANGDLSANDKS